MDIIKTYTVSTNLIHFDKDTALYMYGYARGLSLGLSIYSS